MYGRAINNGGGSGKNVKMTDRDKNTDKNCPGHLPKESDGRIDQPGADYSHTSGPE